MKIYWSYCDIIIIKLKMSRTIPSGLFFFSKIILNILPFNTVLRLACVDLKKKKKQENKQCCLNLDLDWNCVIAQLEDN